MKDGFIIYKSLYEPISELSREEKGLLLEAIFVYQKTGKTINDLTPLVKMAFGFFKNQFDIDQKKYEAKCLKNKENAKKRWDANAYERIQSDAMDADKDKDKDKDKEYSLNFVKLLSFINQKTGRKFKTINEKVKKKYKARLKEGYTKEDILNSIINASNLQYHKENGCQYLTPEFFSRQETLDKYGNEAKGNLIASFPEPVN